MWMHANRFVLATCCGLGLLLTLGCGGEGDGLERRAVEGQVTFAGKPLEAGEIRFIPVAAGPVSAGLIKEGRYEITHRGGVPVGEARVEIVATGAAANLSQDEIDAGATGATIAIPKKYNTQSELRANIESGAEKQTINFELTK